MDSKKAELQQDYKYGFTTDIETELVPKGLNEDVIRLISQKKNEPEWLLNYRLQAFRYWKEMTYPKWAKVKYDPIDFQDISYYAAPKKKSEGPKALEDLDPELLKTFQKLGISLNEQKRISGVAVDLVFDSVSLGTTHQEELDKATIS